jgi:hypothetical protein
MVLSLGSLGESKRLLGLDLVDSQQTLLSHIPPSEQSNKTLPCWLPRRLLNRAGEDISWAIESAAMTENSTPFHLPVVDETLPFPSLMDISELDIRSPEPLETSSSESWLHVHPNLDSSTSLARTNLQDSPPSSPAIASPIFLDTPRETPRPASTEHSSEDTASNSSINALNTGNSSTTNEVASGGHYQTAEVVQQGNTTRKRKAPKAGQHSKRNNSQQEQMPRAEIACLQVEKFIEMEKEKCANLGIAYDEYNYLSPAVEEWITSLDKEDERAAVSMISTSIGSAESIALLQHILVKSRAKDGQIKPAEDLALVDRVREIQQLGSQIAFCQFLRRCHIWKLYTDISREVDSRETGFVVLTSESMGNPKAGRQGNPKNSRESKITKAMICGLASELDLRSQEYDKQYRYYTELRKLGKRLALLTETFGFGVLGLIPTQDPLETVDLGVRISDETWVLFSAQGWITNSNTAFHCRLRKHSRTASICLTIPKGI